MVLRKWTPYAKNIKPFLDEVLEWLKDLCKKANQDTNYQPIFIIDETFDTATEVDIKTVLNSYLNANCHYIGDEIALHDFYFRSADFGHLVYYIKENTNTNPKYRRIPRYLNDQWETLPENEISQLTLVRDGLDSNRFFDPSNRIAFEIQLKEVINFPDVFLYNPNDLKAEEGDFQFNYLDHEGYKSSATQWAFRVLIDPIYKNVKDFRDRKVEFSKEKKSGLVNLLPEINTNGGKYTIRYTYYEKGTKHNSFFGTRAIKLKFSFYGAFLEYLNQTIFYHFDDASLFDQNNRQFFIEDYTNILYNLLRQAKNDERIRILYYVPLGLFEKINSKFLWMVLDETLKGFVTNAGTNTEDIVLHILKGLSKTSNPDDFMKELLYSENKTDTRFSLIYNKISCENFKTFVGLIQILWFNSSYKNPGNNLYKKNEIPFAVNYEAKKEATFFFSNKDIKWVSANLLKFEPDESWWDEVASILSNDLGELVKEFVETEKSFYFHPFQPIAINNFQKQQTGIELTSPLFPAFVLKAGEDVAFWENVTTATEYAVDILTTFSGVGNLAKFRHLAKVASKARKLKFISRTGEVVATARGAVGVIEISSGTVNALLKITNQRDKPWAKELSEFLLILELCSLGADLGEFLLKRARKSAKNALKQEGEIRKKLDEVVIEDGNTKRKLTETEKGKFFDEMYEVAGKISVVRAGSGGFLKYTKIISRNMNKQEEWMSCAAACIRRYADDLGIKITESEVRLLAKTTENGTDGKDVYFAMKSIFKDKNVFAKSYFEDINDLKNFEIMLKDSNGKNFITNVGFPPNKHTIIVDKIEGKKVYIKDPWPLEVDKAYESGIRGDELEEIFKKSNNSVEAIIDLNHFKNLWIEGGNIMFKIK